MVDGNALKTVFYLVTTTSLIIGPSLFQGLGQRFNSGNDASKDPPKCACFGETLFVKNTF